MAQGLCIPLRIPKLRSFLFPAAFSICQKCSQLKNKTCPLLRQARRLDNSIKSGYTESIKKGAQPVDGYALNSLSQMTAIFWTRGRSFCVCNKNKCEQCCKQHDAQNLLIHRVHPLPGWIGENSPPSPKEWRANNRLPLRTAAR